MEQLIDKLGTGMGKTVGFLADSGSLFVVFAVIWLVFGAALIWSQGSVDAAWHSVRNLPLPAEAAIWLLFLPVMIAMWIWESSWTLLWRLTSVFTLAAWTLLVFPKPWR